MLVSIGDPAIVLLLESVRGRSRRGIATFPELFDELVSLLIRSELQKGATLSVVNNVDHVFVEPFGIGRSSGSLCFDLFASSRLSWCLRLPCS